MMESFWTERMTEPPLSVCGHASLDTKYGVTIRCDHPEANKGLCYLSNAFHNCPEGRDLRINYSPNSET